MHMCVGAKREKKMIKVKKYDRVKCIFDNDYQHGIVMKGGSKKIRVVLDGNGSLADRDVVTGHVSLFKPSSKPVPVDTESTPMDDYKVIGYKEFNELSDETIAMHAIIKYKGKKIIDVCNDGQGGENMYHPMLSDKSWNYVRKALSDADQWAQQFGEDKPFEALDSWIGWYVRERPFGITSRVYWTAWQKKMSQ